MKRNRLGTFIRVFCALSIAILLTACPTRLESVRSDDELPEGGSYLSGSFKESRFFLQILSDNYILVLHNEDEDKLYTIKYGFNDNLRLMPVPFGKYIIKSISYTTTTVSGDGKTSKTNYNSIPLPDEWLRPFVVNSNEIVYLGDSVIKKQWFVFFTKRRVELRKYPDYEAGLRAAYRVNSSYYLRDAFAQAY